MTSAAALDAFLPCPHCGRWTWWCPGGVGELEVRSRLECEAAGCRAVLVVIDVDAEGGTVTTMRVDGLPVREACRRVGDAMGPFVLRGEGFSGIELERRLRIWRALGRWRWSHPFGRAVRWLLERPGLARLNRSPVHLEARLFELLGVPDG